LALLNWTCRTAMRECSSKDGQDQRVFINVGKREHRFTTFQLASDDFHKNELVQVIFQESPKSRLRYRWDHRCDEAHICVGPRALFLDNAPAFVVLGLRVSYNFINGSFGTMWDKRLFQRKVQ